LKTEVGGSEKKKRKGKPKNAGVTRGGRGKKPEKGTSCLKKNAEQYVSRT